MPKSLYITTTLPYVNADPHVGFAMEIIRADIIARYKKSLSYEVFFNTGTDEHGSKLWEEANKRHVEVQTYVDENSQKFRDLLTTLNISPDVVFTRTTNPNHIKSAQAFWQKCADAGFIYKKDYQVKYCVGCELAKTDSELDEDGKCPIHPTREIELLAEENYFFKFSAFQDKLLELYNNRPDFVIPDFRFNEIKSFVAGGLEDFSISRSKEKMPWGVPVPDDESQVMYVWFDALVNYISALGWPDNLEQFEKFWISGTPIQYCGKDNLRQQSAMWQAMLLSVDLPTSYQIVINGFYTGEHGLKMSKSIGNVVDPVELVAEYGVDALRYFIARETASFEDSPFTIERFKDTYNSGLANGLGNLTSRIMKMAETNLDVCPTLPDESLPQDFKEALEIFDINKATNLIWEKIAELDKKIQETEPFKLVKTDKEAGIKIISELVIELHNIGLMLESILPTTAEKIKDLIKNNQSPVEPLFTRRD
jgi:methionyl-tRNA synthetase